MSNRELLELAAKAAGLRIVDRSHPVTLYVESEGCKGGVRWSPLTDDGDALRLMVKTGLLADVNYDEGVSEVWGRDPISRPAAIETHNGDPYAATRRAIVRAAAEIGKGIQLQTVEGVLEDNYYKSQAEAEELGRQMQEGGTK